MINILWLCNIVLPELTEEFGFRNKVNMGGWLTGLWSVLNERDEFSLNLCIPIKNPERMRDGRNNRYGYYSFLYRDMGEYDESQTDRFISILKATEPDVIHIWGSEYPHSLAMILAAEKLGMIDRVVLNIQGLMKYCSQCICVEIPNEYLGQGSDIFSLYQRFIQGAELEQKALIRIRKVIGRTLWDKESILKINPGIEYYHCGEILRREMYGHMGEWKVEKCRRHSIFVSQAGYPLKGFHLVLDMIKNLRKKYDDLKIFIAGPDMMNSDGTYAAYIRDGLVSRRIDDVVCFVGNVPADKMIENYLSAHVFLSPSLIENSSNSICEAMMLGVPVVASNVGGTPSQIQDDTNGCLYNIGDDKGLEKKICRIFESDIWAEELSRNAVQRSTILNNREEIQKTMLEIYHDIAVNKR